MNAQRHALLARRLIKACGGLEESEGACRLKRSQLSNFQDPRSGHYMPMDVVADLEAYCGEAIYSGAIAGERPSQAMPKSVVTEACETAEAATALQRLARLAAEDGQLTAHERSLIEAGAAEVEEQLRELRGAAGLAP